MAGRDRLASTGVGHGFRQLVLSQSNIRTGTPPCGQPHCRASTARRDAMHVTIEPGILYFGTPVVLISTVNEDGSFNLAPMSSAFWLGWRCMLGLAAGSKTPQNML